MKETATPSRLWRVVRGVAAVLLGATVVALPVSLVLGLPLPEALNLRFRLQELLLLGAASAGARCGSASAWSTCCW